MWPIVIQPYMMIVGYDICIVDTYHGNRSNVKVKVTETVKHIIVDDSGKKHRQIDTKIFLKQRQIIVFDILDTTKSFNAMMQCLTS